MPFQHRLTVIFGSAQCSVVVVVVVVKILIELLIQTQALGFEMFV